MSKYDAKLTKEICILLQEGNNRGDTCDLADISFETFCQWMKTKPEFKEAVQKAEAKCKQKMIGIIQRAAVITWQAAAWWLERKHRDEFALRPPEDRHSKEEQSKQATDAAIKVLQLMEEASRNANSRRGEGSDALRLDDRAAGLQAQGASAQRI